MEKQNPEFEVPEATKQITKQEVDLLFPPTESENELIYNSLQKVFHENAREGVVPMKRGHQSTQKRTGPDKGA